MKSNRPLRQFVLPGLFVLALFVALWARRPAMDPSVSQLLTFSGQTMGTTFTVKLLSKPELGESDQITSLLQRELDQVVSSMSTYDENSEISRWNQRNSKAPMAVSEPFAKVLASALSVAERSAGAFDVTVQPLVDLWGFGPTARNEKPSEDAIRATLTRVGWKKLDFQANERLLGKAHPRVWLDFSAIAKGFAVDQISERLMALGYQNFFVEIGGEVRATGKKGASTPWRVGIVDPQGRQSSRFSLPLEDQAIATSGSYRNYKMYGDKTFSHTIDPRTGKPVEHRLVSVSVIAKTCMEADAWATALFVLGPTEGARLADAQGLAAHFLGVDIQGKVNEHRTTGFQAVVDRAILTPKGADL